MDGERLPQYMEIGFRRETLSIAGLWAIFVEQTAQRDKTIHRIDIVAVYFTFQERPEI